MPGQCQVSFIVFALRECHFRRRKEEKEKDEKENDKGILSARGWDAAIIKTRHTVKSLQVLFWLDSLRLCDGDDNVHCSS